MKLDEFAFLNQQLAGMLKTGIPLEGALRQITSQMRQDKLRRELDLLAADLEKGTPLHEAAHARELPRLYTELLHVGSKSGNLPAVLTLLADHYHQMAQAWTRLKGLLVYPAIVLASSLVISAFMAFILSRFILEGDLVPSITQQMIGSSTWQLSASAYLTMAWLPTLLLALICASMIWIATSPRRRRSIWWRYSPFRETALAQLASSFALLLQHGCSLKDSLGVMRDLESGSPMGEELDRWHARLAEGHQSFARVAEGGKVVPPLFIWVMAGSGEDWIGGFNRTAELYRARAAALLDMLLYAVLPVSVIALGFLIVIQAMPLMHVFTILMKSLVGEGGEGFE